MYEISIKKITREQVKKREYKVIGKDEEGENKYGYVNDETTEDVTREVYAQKVEELNLENVIKAVNSIA
jgi:hypothetical protein